MAPTVFFAVSKGGAYPFRKCPLFWTILAKFDYLYSVINLVLFGHSWNLGTALLDLCGRFGRCFLRAAGLKMEKVPRMPDEKIRLGTLKRIQNSDKLQSVSVMQINMKFRRFLCCSVRFWTCAEPWCLWTCPCILWWRRRKYRPSFWRRHEFKDVLPY